MKLGYKLLQLSQSGLLIDLNILNQKKIVDMIEIPIYIIGKFTDMDAMCNDLNKHKAQASIFMHLVYTNKKWQLI
jgi:hypothetical protein